MCSTQGWLIDIFCAWLKWDYDSPECTPFVPLRGWNKYKKKKGLECDEDVRKHVDDDDDDKEDDDDFDCDHTILVHRQIIWACKKYTKSA